MRVAETYSHLNGLEWLMVRRESMWDELQGVLASVDANQYRTKVSREKGMKGRRLLAPKELNRRLREEFSTRDWHESRTSYWVTSDHRLIRQTLHLPPDQQKNAIERAGRAPIYSYNQTDFVKQRVAVEVQLGKYSFIAYDLFVKHLAFYVGDHIDLGVEILPMKEMQAEMSSGPGYYEGALYDLVRQGRGVPAVPLILVGVVP